MLPPNLARHLYEAHRSDRLAAGTALPPWYRLTTDQKAIVEDDLTLLRQAIAAAEAEQDLVNAPATAPEPETASPRQQPGECCCPPCEVADLLLDLVESWTAEEPKPPLPRRIRVSPAFLPAAAPATRPAPPGSAEKDRLYRAARAAFEDWEDKGSPLKVVTPPATVEAVWSIEFRTPPRRPGDDVTSPGC